MTSGSAVAQLSAANLALALTPIPPFAEQQRIIAKVDELMAMCDELETAEKELEALEEHFIEYLPKSILQTAVQGKLVPQDLHDEPALESLKRIKAEKTSSSKKAKSKKKNLCRLFPMMSPLLMCQMVGFGFILAKSCITLMQAKAQPAKIALH